ncbi:M48 family metallopeptidase [Natranaerofaba carboxydovora]|uniref:M48 family metallopeptidase n=1 Tax=Natranaerofaba carboxydovora TaxID=2742683 RepID=UPI001F12F0E5|nr:SprT family zinc-dependent metalloprotease [Natranaerofaba carboxydovora]UMZ74205.1 hypothetical protein ACONDI_01786 [Natranaerofaba carboxydovora]
MKTIVLQYENNEFKIQYDVTKSKKRKKTIGITIDTDMKVVVKAPHTAKEEEIKYILQKRSRWIFNKIKELQKVKEPPASKNFVTGEKILFLGEDYPIEIIEVDGKKKKSYIKNIEIYFNNNIFHIVCLKESNSRELIINALEKWFREKGKKIIIERVNYYKREVGVEPNQVRIKTQKKRWGSCSSLGNLNFNWKLAMAPISVIDYVVVHELTHLLYPNHSKEFWQAVESVIPDYKEKREWLKYNGRIFQMN